MIAKLTYEVECPQDCDKEDFLKWLEFHLGVPGACITGDNPLYNEMFSFDSSEYENIEVDG
ncbi:hypothetical protein [Parabacteroides sp.]|uniref:hypothetical protein n=1 Tax=Parabacteroides sp. TaxID=1869337 RepID=UPI00307FFDFF